MINRFSWLRSTGPFTPALGKSPERACTAVQIHAAVQASTSVGTPPPWLPAFPVGGRGAVFFTHTQ